MFTESERQSMSDSIRAGVAPSHALRSIAEIDDECDKSAGSDRDFQILRGPFGAFRIRIATTAMLTDAYSSDRILENPGDALEFAAELASPNQSSSRISPGLPSSLEIVDDILGDPGRWSPSSPTPTPMITHPPCSPLSIGAIFNDLDLPLVEISSATWLTTNEFGRVEDVSDDAPWAQLPPEQSRGEEGERTVAHDLDLGYICPSEMSLTISRPSSVPPSVPQDIPQDIPQDAVFLLKHYSSTILITLTPFRHSKTPWHVLFIPNVKTCLAGLTLGETLDHATLCTFYATLALSSSSIAVISPSDKWHQQAQIYMQHAQRHALHTLQTAYSVPKVAKYKTTLIALLAMVQVSTLTGDRDQAESFLLETEKFIRIKGLNRRKSRKVRLLHHCYAFERITHESSWPSKANIKSAHRRRIRSEIESCGAGAFSQDSLDFALTPVGNLAQEMLRRKGQAEVENDLHLQIPGSWPATLYPEIFGVPEIHVFLLSMIIRLTKAKDLMGSGSEENQISIGEYMKRAKAIERMVYEHSSWGQGFLIRATQEALAIYFNRAVHDVHRRLLQGHVDKVCDCLRHIDSAESGYGATLLLWPALVAAKEALGAETRTFFVTWFTACARRTGASIFLDTLAKVEMAWSEK
ncbi:hypothetical protein DHEL01_v212711 [Diaporthe helianthi]|uniref:Arginine metabolism regulation protein II n=1 Tax=Diaporthe helianthi TaxID=158607 RepID=A0A2P5HF74_DIAHE|nr:hypothetical protein DHEL01_v212711 [Diaporthe helianthi]